MRSTMNAIISSGYGSSDVLKYSIAEKPIPKPHEVLVQIHATSVTAAHVAMRTGKPIIGRLFLGLLKPSNPVSGTDFAGEIVAIGNNVKKFSVGEKVFGSTDIEGGTYAEFLTISENGVLFKKPSNISYAQATAIVDGAATALPFLVYSGRISKGMSVLINGASGSIGTAAVQLAKYFGANVTGVCSTSNIELVKSLGADTVIDYTQTDFTKNGIHYDIIFDTVGVLKFSKVKNSLSEHGTYLSPVLNSSVLFNMLKTSFSKSKKAIFSATGMLDIVKKISNFETIKELLEQELIVPVIDRTYQLPQIPEAHIYVDKGHKKGNVVIDIFGEAHTDLS
tara:strand:- start:328 stop:1338 length:1011 start_codon:yes stop_codon:yes gene_type:complete